jgi:hypothetical protein
MAAIFTKSLGESVPEVIAEAGLGLLGGAALFLIATPTGRQWLQKGTIAAARGASTAGVAIASLFADLRTGWAELIQEVQIMKSANTDNQGQ